MTYEGLFEKCKTLGECKRTKMMLMDKATAEISKLEIERAYKKRREEIRNGWKEHSYA